MHKNIFLKLASLILIAGALGAIVQLWWFLGVEPVSIFDRFNTLAEPYHPLDLALSLLLVIFVFTAVPYAQGDKAYAALLIVLNGGALLLQWDYKLGMETPFFLFTLVFSAAMLANAMAGVVFFNTAPRTFAETA